MFFFFERMFTNRTYLKYSVEQQSADIREFNVKLQQLKSKVSNNSDEIEYVSTDLADFRSNSDDKGLVNYTWVNDSDNNSVLTFDFKDKNIELENLPYEGDITAVPSLDNEFVRTHNIIYGDITDVITDSSTLIDENNKYKITFDGKLKLPEYSAGLFCYDSSNPTQMLHCKEIDLTNVNMNSIVNASCMFYQCSGLTSLDLSNFTGENVTNTSNMFDNCTNLTSIDLTNFTGENVTTTGSMFISCTNLVSIDLSNFTGENVKYATNMFDNCTSLTSLDLRKFTGEKLEYARKMFEKCSSLNTLIIKGSVINKIVNLTFTRLSLNSGITVENDKTYSCTCNYDFDTVKITAATEV